jgi:hypothetical protein
LNYLEVRNEKIFINLLRKVENCLKKVNLEKEYETLSYVEENV